MIAAPTAVGEAGVETVIIGLAGGAFSVDTELPGRASVWDGSPSAAYLPPSVVAPFIPERAS